MAGSGSERPTDAPKPARQRRASWIRRFVGVALLATGIWWALSWSQGDPVSARADASAERPATIAEPATAAQSVASGVSPTAPYTAAAERARLEQHALWQDRLEQAEDELRRYRDSTRYPPTSQPLRLHADQAYPNQPIVEEQALAGPGGRASEGVKLRTSQERVFVQGSESVLFTVALQDLAGTPLPLRIVRASAREMPAPRTASTHPVVTMDFNDAGTSGDAVAGDGTFSARLQPQVEGFAGMAGQIRVEVILQHRDQEGPVYFDIFYTSGSPATWRGGIREALESGSLSIRLGVHVQEPGRYVASARLDDVHGVPFAFLSFNDELQAGPQEIQFTLFGRLVQDAKPAFPLTLRDVEAFLLRPDAFPDRSHMPRLPGPVHQTGHHVLASFDGAEWQSEQRERYLRELGRDAAHARAQVTRFAQRP